MAQYESEARSPKQDLINQLAQIFHVDSRALTVPDIDTYVGLMHTLFALEDMYGLKIKDIDGELCLCLDKLFFVKYFSLKKASEFPFFSKGFSLPSAGIMHPCA